MGEEIDWALVALFFMTKFVHTFFVIYIIQWNFFVLLNLIYVFCLVFSNRWLIFVNFFDFLVAFFIKVDLVFFIICNYLAITNSPFS